MNLDAQDRSQFFPSRVLEETESGYFSYCPDSTVKTLKKQKDLSRRCDFDRDSASSLSAEKLP